MSTGIDLKGVTEVLNQFDYRETPFFAVYQGKDLKFENIDDDLEAARNLLETHLKQLENNGSTAPFKITWYKRINAANERPDQNSLMGSNTFRVTRIGSNMQDYFAIQRGDLPFPSKMNGVDESLLTRFEQTLAGIESRLTAMEMPLEESEENEEDQTPTQKILGALSGVIQHPQVQELLANKLIGFLNMIPTSQPQLIQPTNKINQMPISENDLPVLNEYLQILIGAGMGLEDFKKLSNIAQNNPQQFSMLLGMLKTQ